MRWVVVVPLVELPWPTFSRDHMNNEPHPNSHNICALVRCCSLNKSHSLLSLSKPNNYFYFFNQLEEEEEEEDMSIGKRAKSQQQQAAAGGSRGLTSPSSSLFFTFVNGEEDPI